MGTVKLVKSSKMASSKMATQGASVTDPGIVELATSAETQTGTDTERAVTPAGLAATIQHDMPVAASFVIGTEGTNVINVGVQLKDEHAANMAVRGAVFAYLSDDANGDSIVATAPSGGWAIGTDGLLIPVVAGKAAQLVSESDGDIDVNITETGTKTVYLVLVMPTGKLVASGAITFAA